MTSVLSNCELLVDSLKSAQCDLDALLWPHLGDGSLGMYLESVERDFWRCVGHAQGKKHSHCQ